MDKPISVWPFMQLPLRKQRDEIPHPRLLSAWRNADMDLKSMRERMNSQIMSTDMMQVLMSGNVSQGQYQAYLADAYCYALHSAQVMAVAGNRLVLSHPPLARYLLRRAAEKLGHDKWAVSDLMDLGLTSLDIVGIAPSSPCACMIGLEYYYAAHDNPVGLFGWVFVLESLDGGVGEQMAQMVNQVLRLNGKATCFLRGHGASEDLSQLIAANVKSAEDRNAFARMARETEDLYCAILDNALRA